MTLQWTVIALILYGEIGVVLLLLLPWIRPTLWKKFFNSRFVQRIKRFSTVYSYAAIVILLLLFFDACREVRKYSHPDYTEFTGSHRADTDSVLHMRLFRAQRNLYISGFALLLALVINRIIGLLARAAHLEAAAEAAMKQAEGASKAAEILMNDGNDDELTKKWETEKKGLLKKLKSAEDDRDAMKAQAKNLQLEYDRLCDEFNTAEKKGSKKSSGGKKVD
jgi:B-cell receptor-associated protein 31